MEKSKIIDSALSSVPIEDLQNELSRRTKNPVGRPKTGTTKARKNFRIQARTLALIEAIADATGHGQGDTVEHIAECYAKILIECRVETPSIVQVDGVKIKNVLDTTTGQYINQIINGRWIGCD